ncbi:Probable Co/Zn/Cd efflux system membrane fusion protein [hydrothermal vent metagenome]|uniref:Probable Co/Zn/Cd efflux system membrane fusion protein n=1 Tax=hydrothermal vent metagenome TaxID=652676 RepID=A0A3B0T9E5_9ZZZZ
MKKHTYLIASISLILFASSCGSDEKKTTVDNTAPIIVKTSAVEADSNNPFVTASGKIQAANSADLSTRMMGYVNKIHVKVGDNVRKGQLLISINNTDLQAKRAQVNAGITEATAAYNNAKKDYDRFKNLFAENSASQKELDDITAHYKMAKARLESANQMKNEINAQFSYTNIKAPFKGKITNKFIETGDMANPGMPLISVETPGKYEVMAMVPENTISKIESGTEVEVLVKAIQKTLKGKVIEVSTSAKNTGGQYLVKVSLEKTDAKILSGMFSTVQFPIEKDEKTSAMVLIPTEVLVNRGQLSGIYTISQSNTALLRWLRLGRTYGDKIEVLSGLTADEAYITSAEGKLFNGAKITVQ